MSLKPVRGSISADGDIMNGGEDGAAGAWLRGWAWPGDGLFRLDFGYAEDRLTAAFGIPVPAVAPLAAARDVGGVAAPCEVLAPAMQDPAGADLRAASLAGSVADLSLPVAAAIVVPPIDLSSVAAGSGGFVIHGEDSGDGSGYSVASAGDLNGDGYADLLIGAPNADAAGNLKDDAGDSYVVFGKADGFGAAIDLAEVAAGNGGFVIHGEDATDDAGFSVASAGDINGDGYADLMIGAPGYNRDAGRTYVLLGHAGSFPTSIDLADVALGAESPFENHR